MTMPDDHPHTGRDIARSQLWWAVYHRFQRHPDPPDRDLEARLPPLAARVFYVKGEIECLQSVIMQVYRDQPPTAQQFDLCYILYASLYDAELKARLEQDVHQGLERIFAGLQADAPFLVYPDNWFFHAPVRSMMTGDLVLIPDTSEIWAVMPVGWEKIG